MNTGESPLYNRTTAVAWVCENVGDEYDALATFHVYVDTDELSEGYEEGPDEVPIEPALAWARSRASTVIVRCCESIENTFYSAGEIPARRGKPWPEAGLSLMPRRLPGWEHLDRTTADAPIQWDVIVRGDVVPQPVGFGRAFRRALIGSGRADLLETRITGPFQRRRGEQFYNVHGETVRAALRVTARTHAEASELASWACAVSAERALFETSQERDHDVSAWGADAYPTGSWAAKSKARVEPSRGIFR